MAERDPISEPNLLGDNVERLVLIHDPTGMYPRDHWFHRGAWSETLDDGYWPTGSVWRVEVNKAPDFYLIVRGEELEPQTAVRYKGKVNRLGQDNGSKPLMKIFYGDPDAFTPRRSRPSGRPSNTFS